MDYFIRNLKTNLWLKSYNIYDSTAAEWTSDVEQACRFSSKDDAIEATRGSNAYGFNELVEVF